MRILVTAFPALGHFHPLAPLALAFQHAGHDVRVATGPDLVDWVHRCGLTASPCGLSQAEAVRSAERQYPAADAVAHQFTDVWVNAMLPDLRHLIASWTPDLVLHEEQEYTGLLLAATLGVPCVTHSWPAPARPATKRQEAVALLAAVWSAQGLAPTTSTTGDLYLDACPTPLQSDDAIRAVAAVSQVLTIRPVPFDGPPMEPPEWLTRMERPAAYVTLGTVPSFSTPARLRTLCDAVSALLASVLVTTGPNAVAALGKLPANVHAEPYLAQSLVLPHVDLVVSHGGAGGTVGALLQGVPHLALPLGGQSQSSAAARIQTLGIGLRLLPEEQTLGAIQAAAGRLLHDPSYARRTAHLRAELERHPAPDDVVHVLEERYGRRTDFHAVS